MRKTTIEWTGSTLYVSAARAIEIIPSTHASNITPTKRRIRPPHLISHDMMGAAASLSPLHHRLNLCGTDEIVLRKPANRMRAVTHGTLVVSDLQVGMMIFAVADPRRRVDERHRFVIVFERECPGDLLVIGLCPTLEALQQRPHLRRRQRWHAPFARLALLLSQIAGHWRRLGHGNLPVN